MQRPCCQHERTGQAAQSSGNNYAGLATERNEKLIFIHFYAHQTPTMIFKETCQHACCLCLQAFQQKIEKQVMGQGLHTGGLHKRGCHCKKSHCKKKYCECFQVRKQERYLPDIPPHIVARKTS